MSSIMRNSPETPKEAPNKIMLGQWIKKSNYDSLLAKWSLGKDYEFDKNKFISLMNK